MATPQLKVKGILIDPKARSITEVSFPKKDYRKINDLLECSCFTCFGMPNGDTAFVDDEGLIKGDEHLEKVGCYRFTWADQSHLAGKTLIVNTDDEGESADCVSKIEDLEKEVVWVPTPTTKQLDDLLKIEVIPMDTATIIRRTLG